MNSRDRPVPDMEDVVGLSATLASPQQRWNNPSINIFRTGSAFYGFLMNGLNDASLGPLLPYLQHFYAIEYTAVSLLFLSPLVGYVVAAFSNNWLTLRLGWRGAATLAPACRLLAYIVISVHPPFAVVVIVLMFVGFGTGYQDASWNAWMGTMANSTELLGLLHGFYGLGALLSPLIATSMVAKGGLMWYYFFYFMIGAQAFEILIAAPAFWSQDGKAMPQQDPSTPPADAKPATKVDSTLKQAVFKRPFARVTWLCAFFLLGYVGTEAALGGWTTSFMLKVRLASPFSSSMATTGFWLGLTLGRFTLGFVTRRIGEKLAISIYLPIIIFFHLVYWLVPNFYASAIGVSLEGYFLGPMFPGAVVAITKLLPGYLHISSISFAATVGKCGGSIFPFAVGAIAQVKGVEVLQPIIVGLHLTIFLLWSCLPKMNKEYGS